MKKVILYPKIYGLIVTLTEITIGCAFICNFQLTSIKDRIIITCLLLLLILNFGIFYKIDCDSFYYCFFSISVKVPYTEIYKVEYYMLGVYLIFATNKRLFLLILPFEKRKIFMILDYIIKKNKQCEICDIKDYENYSLKNMK
ncbi:hypothetical protein E4O03_08895 [Treponema sp. OMZ 792]|uniref:hypothetical protein n=1 Tax=unclassified Treponema TaxID=2638727 RepID=UPI0020A35199|nr:MULTISPECIES: hypothetical protein [unclassified Treponema]UTC74347.1 hypothetical protein E4O03_08895 [Treponema sp. OMZ 792]UTC80745.1 hypothetical protein E4O07_08810 [Treponema sp. OMZ 798]